MMRSSLFVDDEQNVLSAVKRMFFDQDYDLFFALSGQEGLSILAKHPASVIVSDMQMPVMNGVEFLERSQRICPDAIRIVFSGHADLTAIMEVINKGGIWRYIAKPWDDNDVRVTIKNAFEIYDRNIERKKLLEELREKNELLETMNEQLELKIQERTVQIEAQNKMLKMILEWNNLGSILAECCKIIKVTIQTDAVYVCSTFNEEIFSSRDSAVPPAVSDLAKKTSRVRERLIREYYALIPLCKGENVFGAIIVENVNGIDEALVSYTESNFAPVVAIALSQQKTLKEVPDLMKNIDSIIQNI
jgi:FixJ family two-component response regulator